MCFSLSGLDKDLERFREIYAVDHAKFMCVFKTI